MYDAIVIGARVAGSPTAMLLARQGYRVLLVDRASFPSDIMSTHYIHQPGVAALKRWGLLDQVVATGCPPMTSIRLDFGPVVLRGAAPSTPDGVAVAYCPRRFLLDKILVDAAVAAGAELRERFSVQELLTEDGRVTGIRGRGADGGAVTEQARIVIGADGMHSVVARAVQAPTYHEQPSYTAGYYSYFSGVRVDDVEWYPRAGQMAIAFPTNNGLACIAAVTSNARFAAYRADIEGGFMRVLDECAPGLAERVRGGRREERWVGTAEMPNFFRVPFGRGWALVGDAGYHKDPITGQGITDAFHGAELLAEALDAAWAGRQSLDDALARYQQRRDQLSMPIYELTTQLARLEPPPPDLAQVIAALADNQADTDRFMGLVAGTTPFAEFFAPESIGRIMAAASRDAA